MMIPVYSNKNTATNSFTLHPTLLRIIIKGDDQIKCLIPSRFKHLIWSSPLMMIPVYSNKNIASNSFTRSILHKNLGPPERQINIKLSTVFASVPGLLNSFSKFNSAMVRGGSRDFEKG